MEAAEKVTFIAKLQRKYAAYTSFDNMNLII